MAEGGRRRLARCHSVIGGQAFDLQTSGNDLFVQIVHPAGQGIGRESRLCVFQPTRYHRPAAGFVIDNDLQRSRQLLNTVGRDV